MASGDTITLSAIPVGSIHVFPIATAPEGYFECAGQELDKTVEVALFAIVGTLYGETDGIGGVGTSHFKLPDLRGEFVRGFDNNKGTDAARTIGSFQLDELKEHDHSYWGTQNESSMASGGFSNERLAAVESVGLTGGNETRPRNIAMLYCIKR